MKFMNFQKDKQTKFLKSIKDKINEPWENIAKSLEISRSMIYFYLNEHSKLPYKSYIKLCKISNTPFKKIKTVEIKNKEESIKIPKINSERLAEFIGAIAGDGHLNKKTYEVSICVDKDLDKDYIYNNIIVLFNKLFGLKPRIYIQKNKLKCFVYSKKLIEYLNSEFKIPIGKKKGNLKIPSIIKNNNVLLKSYIRGLFDTDGSIYRHHKKNSGVVSIISRDPQFIKEVLDSLIKLKLRASKSNKNIYIYARNDIDKFFSMIKPNNPKHNLKYEYLKNKGEIPLSKDLFKIKR